MPFWIPEEGPAVASQLGRVGRPRSPGSRRTPPEPLARAREDHPEFLSQPLRIFIPSRDSRAAGGEVLAAEGEAHEEEDRRRSEEPEEEVPALSHLREVDQSARGLEPGPRDPPPLLGQAPRDDGKRLEVSGRDGMPHMSPAAGTQAPDLGDLLVILLAGTLTSFRDRLAEDGFYGASDLVGDLVDVVDDYLTSPSARGSSNGGG